MPLLVEISPGELIDKLTILEIKLERISDASKLANVDREHAVLKSVCDANFSETPRLLELKQRLKQINAALWEIEDSIRELERDKDFGEGFIALARSVYQTNDRRAATKREINDLLNSDLFEEKSYAAY